MSKDNNGWIKCSDRFPSIGERVLVWGGVAFRLRPRYRSLSWYGCLELFTETK